MKISIVLVDDWELRGTGEGDMGQIQFSTLSKLLDIYEKYNFKASINAEIMQQLYHIRYGAKHNELKIKALQWENVIKEAYSRGHDVQLHIHPQWKGAQYENKKWLLPGNWSIISYPRDSIKRMVKDSKDYLENLIQELDPAYKCVSFRSGAWAIAPSNHILTILAEEKIVFDISIVKGLYYNNSFIQLDYRNCEESFQPFYPNMKDARKLSDKKEPITCVPTFSFVPSLFSMAKKDIGDFKRKLKILFPNKKTSIDVNNIVNTQYNVWRPPIWRIDLRLSELLPKLTIADLSYMNYAMMKDMLVNIRKKAKKRGLDRVAIVLENHTKDLIDFSHIEKFTQLLSQQDDIEVITLTQLAHRLQHNVYAVISKSN